MTQFTLIPGAKLMPMLKKLVKQGAEFHAAIHQFAISSMHHACKTGDTSPLNTFFNDVLTENYKTAFRQFLRRVYRDWPESECIAYETENGFVIGGSDAKNRQVLAALCEKELLNPDGVKVMRFYERNVIKEHQEFGDVEFTKQLKALMNRATNSTEQRTSRVSKDLTDKLQNVIDFATARAEQESLKTAA
jgi:hypothetical protein